MRALLGPLALVLCALVGSASASIAICPHSRISAGVTHTCTIDNTYNVRCFGQTSDGRGSPGVLTAADKFVSIAVGWRHSCAIKNTRVMSCFGFETPLDTRLLVPPPPDWPRQSAGGFYWKYMSLGVATSCAIMNEDRLRYSDNRPPDDWSLSYLEAQPTWLPNNQTLLCWGSPTRGQIHFPVFDDWSRLSSGGFHACGIRAGTVLYCWGENSFAQLSPYEGINQNMTARIIPGDFLDVAAGQVHTCAILTSGLAMCWGDNRFGQTVVPCDTTWLQLCAGDRHSCGITTSNMMLCWGDNESGQTNVDETISDWMEVTCGVEHSCGLRSSGQLICWGANQYGQATPPPGLTVVDCNTKL